MVIIKVSYKNTNRRFAISENSWSELKANLCNLFSIPPNTEICLSYVDEDGDVITLSTDIEFREVFSGETSGVVRFDLITIENNGNDVSASQLTDIKQANNKNNDESSDFNTGSKLRLEGIMNLTQSENTRVPQVPISPDHSKDVNNNMNISMILGSTQMQVDERNDFSNTLENRICDDDDLYFIENKTLEASTQQNDNKSQYLENFHQFKKLVEQSRDVLTKYPQILETINQIMKEIIRTVPENTENFDQWINSFKPSTLRNSRSLSSTTQSTNTCSPGNDDSNLHLNFNFDLPPLQSFTDDTQAGVSRVFSPFTVPNDPPTPLYPDSNPETRVPSISTYSSIFNPCPSTLTSSDNLGRGFANSTATSRYSFNDQFGPPVTQNNTLQGFHFDPRVSQSQTTNNLSSKVSTDFSSTNPFVTPNFLHNQRNISSQTSHNLDTSNFIADSFAAFTSSNSGMTSTESCYDLLLKEKQATLTSMGFTDEKENEKLLGECGGRLDLVVDRLLSADRNNMS